MFKIMVLDMNIVLGQEPEVIYIHASFVIFAKRFWRKKCLKIMVLDMNIVLGQGPEVIYIHASFVICL